MSTGIQIRQATSEDATLLADLGARTFAQAFADANDPSDMDVYLKEAFSIKKMEEELAEAGNTFLIAFASDAQPAGYAKLRAGQEEKAITMPNPVEIERIYAEKAYHGKGVGAALMQACLDAAKKAGYASVWLGVWQENPRAIRFYEKWGFEKVGIHVFMLGDDEQHDWLMARVLT